MSLVLVGALLIGLTLGMLGSGGSAITVPVLVYLVGHGAKESIAESMAIVGLISLAAAVPYAKSHQIDWRSVWYFGIPGMGGTLIGAWLGGVASAALQLMVFGSVLLVAAVAMWRSARRPQRSAADHVLENQASEVIGDPRGKRSGEVPIGWIAVEGTLVGILTGFVGVGGGFLIVPALVVFGKLPMRLAIGTSLVIIAAKAAVGFAKYEHHLLRHDLSVDWATIAVFTLLGVLGSLAGRAISSRLNQRALKQVFAGFLILLGGFVLVQEARKIVRPPQPAATVVDASPECVGVWLRTPNRGNL